MMVCQIMKARGVLFLMAWLLTGCASFVTTGNRSSTVETGGRVFLPSFQNATDEDHAGRALTEIAASVLLERGIAIVQTEPALVKSRMPAAAGNDGLFVEVARELQATHLLIGTVHEYRYKTDLDGDPVVGVSLRLVDVKDGATLWQGSSSHVSIWQASLTKTAQKAMRALVKQLPLAQAKKGKRSPAPQR